MKIRYVLFDAVGTLIRVHPSVSRIYWETGQRFGSQLAEADVRARFATSFESYHDEGPTSEAKERERWRSIVADVLDDITDSEKLEEAFEELWKVFASPEPWEVFADVVEAWGELEWRGYPIGIASNFDQRLLGLVPALPPLDRARSIFVSSALGYPKPHPEFFRLVEKELQCAPEEILLVGDCPRRDWQGASRAGWQAVLLDRAAQHPRENAIRSLKELPELLFS